MIPAYADKLKNILTNKTSDIDMIEIRIVLNCSGVIFGHKPASTITFKNGQSSQNQLKLWDKYKDLITSYSKIKYYELKRCSEYCTILMFDNAKLSFTLNNCEISEFLAMIGYTKNASIDDNLANLKERFNYSFPHEIGIFLGIPLKDVQGYMGFNNLCLSCTNGWNIYGPAGQSKRLYNQYNMCRNNAIHLLSMGIKPCNILKIFPS